MGLHQSPSPFPRLKLKLVDRLRCDTRDHQARTRVQFDQPALLALDNYGTHRPSQHIAGRNSTRFFCGE